MNKQRGSISLIFAIVFGVLFLIMTFVSLWAVSERSKYKNDTDAIVADAVDVAVQEAETAKDAEFVELEKSPVRTYKGPATFGSVQFEYPKTWSLYADEDDAGTVLDVFGHPSVIPGFNDEKLYALRVEIVSKSYDSELKSYESKIERGDIKARAFRPEKVNSVLGTRLEGEIATGVNGTMILLPIRDRTLLLYTESEQFEGDLNNIILPSLTFVP